MNDDQLLICFDEIERGLRRGRFKSVAEQIHAGRFRLPFTAAQLNKQITNLSLSRPSKNHLNLLNNP